MKKKVKEGRLDVTSPDVTSRMLRTALAVRKARATARAVVLEWLRDGELPVRTR